MKRKQTVRCSFELDAEEARALCEMRAEPKPSTAAAQVGRLALRAKGKPSD
jgi:hypothetical protein